MKRKSVCNGTLRIFSMFSTAILFLLLEGAAFGQLQTPTIQASDQVDAIAITVTPFGPYPTSVQHSSSPFMLFVVNRSGVLDETFSLVVKPSSSSGSATSAQTGSTSATSTGTTPTTPGPSLLDLHSTAALQRDHQLIRPLSGNYQLRFQSHPDWVVDIAITQ